MADDLGTLAAALPEAELRKLKACVELIGRTGASTWQLRYDDREPPCVWTCVVEYDRGDGGPWEAAAGRGPLEAVVRLVERLVDGGICHHCGRPTALDTFDDDHPMRRSVAALGCLYSYDPDEGSWVRGCELRAPV